MDAEKKKVCIRTFAEYDALLESFEGVSIEPYWPKEEDFVLFEQDPEKWMVFLIYMSEMVEPDYIKAEYSKSRINKFLREHLVLTE